MRLRVLIASISEELRLIGVVKVFGWLALIS